MSVTLRILASWRRPRQVMRSILAGNPGEGHALVFLLIACLLIFVAQLPGLARAAHLDPEIPLDARMGGALMATMFMLPLLAYVLAGISHLIARLFGGRGSFLDNRIALFWALLAIAPFMLLQGLVMGMVGPGPGASLLGFVVLAGFLFQWLSALSVAEGRADDLQQG